jgi:class 3 adenylate cyclase
VAKLADAPDLGLRNHRFQIIALRFNPKRFYEGKTRFWRKSCNSRMATRKIVILAQILAQTPDATVAVVAAVWGNVRSEGVGPDAVAAVHAALAMRVELANLNRKWLDRGWPQLRAGIAINHGEVVVGNIGSPQRMEFTVIGEAVNVSWKLQELTKKFDCDFIVSETVQRLVGDCIELRAIGFVDLPGLENPVELFTATSSAHIDSDTNPFPQIDRAEMEPESQRVT